MADLEGKCLSVNPACTAVLGWSESELLGKTSQWLLHPEDREMTRAEIRQLASGRKTLRFENRLRDKEGSYHWISWKAVPDRERIYAVGRDVTELKDAEDRLQETRQELTQVARRATMAVISAALAHEIKQPLGAMVANANASLRWLAKAPPDVDKVRTILEDIVADGHRVSDVIQSVRSIFSQSDQPGTVLDLNELIRETIGLTRGDLDSAHVVAHLELGLQLPSICAHRVQLQQVLLNIVANAVDAMRSTSGRARVLRVRSRPVEFDGVEVTVQDSGIGIEPENVDRIFHAFFTTKPSGMGMGLAICRSIVEAHGGSLSVAATVPHGSAFRIVLPSRR